MYKLKDQFIYVKNKTLTGEKLIAGIKETSSYILIKKDYENSFYSLVDKLSSDVNFDVKSLDSKEKSILKTLILKGFLKNSNIETHSFNEYGMFLKKIFEKKICENIKNPIINKYVFIYMYVFIILIGIILLLFNYDTFMSIRLELNRFTILELLFCIFVLPVVVHATHEFGHYFIAKILGVKVDSVVFGFFVTWPTIFIKYKGINLHKTWEKVFVASAGITAHLINMLIGLFLDFLGIKSIILTVWIIANISMAVGNMIFLGPTDGYFMLTSLIGVYNFRYRGYKGLSYLFHKKVKSVNKLDLLCGVLLFILWLISFFGIYLTFRYYAMVLNVSVHYANLLSIPIILLLLIRFIIKLRRLN